MTPEQSCAIDGAATARLERLTIALYIVFRLFPSIHKCTLERLSRDVQEMLRLQSHIHLEISNLSKVCGQSDDPFVCYVASRASSDKFIILAAVDIAFIDMAFNLYESSFRPHGIDNFLFVDMGRRVCQKLSTASLPCVRHSSSTRGFEAASRFNSKGFNRKVLVKVDAMLDALAADYTVLLVDVDVVFLKNPIPHLKVKRSSSDLQQYCKPKS